MPPVITRTRIFVGRVALAAANPHNFPTNPDCKTSSFDWLINEQRAAYSASFACLSGISISGPNKLNQAALSMLQ